MSSYFREVADLCLSTVSFVSLLMNHNCRTNLPRPRLVSFSDHHRGTSRLDSEESSLKATLKFHIALELKIRRAFKLRPLRPKTFLDMQLCAPQKLQETIKLPKKIGDAKDK